MLDPYKMVFVNITTSLLVLAGTIIYRYVYPKKKINLFILLLIISILPIISIFRPGTYESGDFNIHIHRIMSFYDSLREGLLMPSWAAELNATYGIPVFVFNYSLSYYFISFFHFLGISFISSTKIYLGLNLYFSGIFMYMWIKKLTNNQLAAFTSAIFYIFNPYHLIDIHFRATLGESTIFTLIPLLFFMILKYFRRSKFIYLILTSILTGLLFLAHPVLAIIFLTLAIFYVFYFSRFYKNRKIFFPIILALIIGVFASIYVWIPYILYSPYMYSFKSSPISESSFYPFIQLIYSPWRYGLLFQGPKGELAQIIGYTQILILLVSIFILFIKKTSKKIKLSYSFWIFLCVLLIFLMHPLSIFMWRYINDQFFNMIVPYGRLSLAISFLTSVIAGYFTLVILYLKINKKYIYIILVITVGLTILNWGHRRVIPEIDDNVLREDAWKSIGITPPFINPKWAKSPTFWFPKRPDNSMDIIKGVGTIKLLKKTTTKHMYMINARSSLIVRENTLYFPGWEIKANGKTINSWPDKEGVINFKIKAGKYYIEVIYEDLLIYKLTKIISLLSLLSISLTILYLNFKKLLSRWLCDNYAVGK